MPDQDARPDEIDLMVARHSIYTVGKQTKELDPTAETRIVIGNVKAPRIAPERLATERAELMGILASDAGIPPANIDDLATRLGRAFAPSELAALDVDAPIGETLPGLKPSDIQNVQRTIRGMRTMTAETKAPGLLSLFQRITAPEPGREKSVGISR